MACLNVEKISRIIFWTDLFWSFRYKISCISQRVTRMFAEKWFFIFDKNQLVIRSKLFRWSADFLAFLPLNPLQGLFLFWDVVWYLMLQILYVVGHVAKWFIHQNFVSFKTYVIKLRKWCGE